jgi:hypothetical protein
MNFALLFRAFDTAVVLRDAVQRLRAPAPAPTTDGSLTQSPQPQGGLSGQLETQLTGVVVAALKEAFNRDHARLELERAQLDEQRRRAEDAMRLEVRRQAADREVGRLRLLAATALIGWIASVLLLVARLGSASTVSRAVSAAGWLLLLGALAAAFSAQGRVDASSAGGDSKAQGDAGGSAALWLLVAGLALSAVSLLF